jgi:hypothetical protein
MRVPTSARSCLPAVATIAGVLTMLTACGGSAPPAAVASPTPTPYNAHWTTVQPVVSPPARAEAGVATLAHGDLLFGGRAQGGAPLGDTWLWDGYAWHQQQSSVAPPSRSGPAIADAPGIGTLVFGGLGVDGALGDTWLWDGRTWSRRASAVAPPARSGATLAYDLTAAELILFGGERTSGAGTTYLDDTWAWTPAGWRQLHPGAAPSPRSGARSVASPLNAGVLLFGGRDRDRVFQDTWLWKAGTWVRERPAQSPPPSADSWLGINPATRHLIVFTPQVAGAPPANQIWRWDGTMWHMAGTEGVAPVARSEAAFAYDPVRRLFLLFGGSAGTTYYADTWEVTCAHPQVNVQAGP